MRTHRPRCALLALLVVLGFSAAACGGRGDGLRGAPQPLIQMLAVMPADAVHRGLYYTDLEALGGSDAKGFGTVLPLGAEATRGMGFSIEDASQILETGDPASIVLRGAFDAEAIADGFASLGYARDDAGGWMVFRRSGDLPAGAPAATIGIPAAALRDDLLFLGGTHELGSVTGSAVVTMDFDWIERLSRAVSPAAAAVALGPLPASFAAEAARSGTDVPGLLQQAGVRSALPAYEGFALAYAPRGDAATNGLVALAYAPDAHGADPALQLAVRVATAHLVGASSLQAREAMEGGAPRWIEDERVVFVPVSWGAFDGEALRGDLRRGRLLFLAPLSDEEADSGT